MDLKCPHLELFSFHGLVYRDSQTLSCGAKRSQSNSGPTTCCWLREHFLHFKIRGTKINLSSTMYLSPTTKWYQFDTLKIKHNLLIISHLHKRKVFIWWKHIIKNMKYYFKSPCLAFDWKPILKKEVRRHLKTVLWQVQWAKLLKSKDNYSSQFMMHLSAHQLL